MRIHVQRQQGTCCIDVAFHSDGNGITALFGPSGAGKSSVINMVAGLQKPDSGSIFIQGCCLFDAATGVNLPPEKRNVGYVFQDGLLFPHLSVKENLLYGKRRRQSCRVEVDFAQVVNLLGIEKLLARRPKTLSGGEKQRVAFGRAILSNPDMLLMDEPLAALDAARKEEMLPFIKMLNARFGIPMLYVSHSLEEILRLTDRVITLENGKIASTKVCSPLGQTPLSLLSVS